MAQLSQEEVNRHHFHQGTSATFQQQQPDPGMEFCVTAGASSSTGSAGRRNMGQSSSVQSTVKKRADTLDRVDILTAMSDHVKKTSTYTTALATETNLHPSDISKDEVTDAASKAPKDAYIPSTRTVSHAVHKGWGSDDDDDDNDDDLFGGKNLMAKFRLHKQQQQKQHGIAVVTRGEPNSPQKSRATLTHSGLQTAKQGVALAFSDDDDEFDCSRSLRRPNIKGRRRSRNDSTEDSPTPISQENSLGSSYERDCSEKRKLLSFSQDSNQSVTNSRPENSSEDEASPRPEKACTSFKKKTSIDNHRFRSMEDEGSLKSLSKEQRPLYEMDESEESLGLRKRAHRNPVALHREESEATGRQKSVDQCFSDGDSEGFMSDCDSPVNLEVKPKPQSIVRKSRKRSPKIESTKHKRKKGRLDSDNGNDIRVLFEDDSLGVDDEDLEKLKPALPNPKFGPYEPMEPLVLGERDGREVSVPASLNRYLAPFQKQGVEFMYKCLDRKSGVILGDEMVSCCSRKVIKKFCLKINIVVVSKGSGQNS
jgi:hypothetical protein